MYLSEQQRDTLFYHFPFFTSLVLFWSLPHYTPLFLSLSSPLPSPQSFPSLVYRQISSPLLHHTLYFKKGALIDTDSNLIAIASLWISVKRTCVCMCACSVFATPKLLPELVPCYIVWYFIVCLSLCMGCSQYCLINLQVDRVVLNRGCPSMMGGERRREKKWAGRVRRRATFPHSVLLLLCSGMSKRKRFMTGSVNRWASQIAAR